MKEKNKKTLGFTMIEILVVLAIIGLLAAAAGANYMTSLRKGRDGKRQADLEQIRSALEMYRADTGNYPRSDPANWGWDHVSSDVTTTPIYTALVPTYIAQMPRDPKDPNGWRFPACTPGDLGYFYRSLPYPDSQNGTSLATGYQITTAMETPQTTTNCSPTLNCFGNPPPTSCYLRTNP